MRKFSPYVLLLVSAAPLAVLAETEELEPIQVTAERVANPAPAGTFATVATALRYDPEVNLQFRGLPESQADITIRGSLFENTGFRLGAATVFDPQTGHYTAELPIDPAMLSAPRIVTGVDHALSAFNAAVATVQYGFRSIDSGGRFHAGFGSDSLWFASLRAGQAGMLASGTEFGGSVAAAVSKGDGTLPNGDHDIKRFSGRLQWKSDLGETNLLVGYQDKFFGWPGMYTGFAALPETDHTKTGLVLADHRWTGQQGWYEVTAAYRWLEDDYDFDRRTQESGAPGSFDHETRSFSLGLQGMHHLGGLDWHFASQVSADRLVRSTDLTNGEFNSRSYLNVSLAPGKRWELAGGNSLSLKAGLRLDVSNRDENAILPLAALELEQSAGEGVNRYGLSFAGTSQLPGYTALNSRPAGLFGGNPDLGREYADVLEFSFEHSRNDWMVRTAVFRRWDEDLVDWTFRSGAPFSRQANAVDIDVSGFEALLARRFETLEVIAGYAFIDKDADYGSAQVDASFYALNFARHRATLALVYEPTETLELRMDNEYRVQEENALRSSRDEAYLASLALAWRPPFAVDSQLVLVADNLTDDDFQEFPGTPAYGRHVSLSIALDW